MKTVFFVLVLCFSMSLAATGWFKAHGDLKNTGVHPFAKGIRSLAGAEWTFGNDPTQEYYEGSVAFDGEGNGFILGEDLYAARSDFDGTLSWSAQGAGDNAYGGSLVFGNKLYFVGEDYLFTIDKNFDNTTVPHKSADLISGTWSLYGAGASYWTSCSGARKVLLINGDGQLAIFNTTGELEEVVDLPTAFPGSAKNEYTTPTVDGDMVYWTAYKSPASPVFSYNMVTGASSFIILNTTFTGGSALISESSVMAVGNKLYLNSIDGSVICLNKADLSKVWIVKPQTNPITSGSSDLFMNIALSPQDNHILFSVSDSTDELMSLMKLNAATGAVIASAVVNITNVFGGSYTVICAAAGPVVSADGVAYMFVNLDGTPDAVAISAVDTSSMTVLWTTVGNGTVNHELEYASVAIGHDGSLVFPDDDNGYLLRFGCELGVEEPGNSGVCGAAVGTAANSYREPADDCEDSAAFSFVPSIVTAIAAFFVLF